MASFWCLILSVFLAETVSNAQSVALKSTDIHISVTGAVFKRDTSNSFLGEAYSDPDGLMWGSPLMEPGRYSPVTKEMQKIEAKKYCEKGAARLPTKNEFKRLANYLGQGIGKYTTLTADGTQQVIPNLWSDSFWASTSESLNGVDGYIYVFYGDTGQVYGVFASENRDLAILCVSEGSKPSQ
jgi:hypothetical protein